MSIPKRRLMYSSEPSAPSRSGGEKPRSSAPRGIQEWAQEYLRSIEQAQTDYLLIFEQGEPEEALEGHGEVFMSEAPTVLVQEQLSELPQQIDHVIQACNNENETLEGEFGSVSNTIQTIEVCLTTENHRISTEVSRVGSQMLLQQDVLQEVQMGIKVLEGQDDPIVEDASTMFPAVATELQSLSKRISDNTIQILAVKQSSASIQKGMKNFTTRIDSVIWILAPVTKTLNEVPSKKDLTDHANMMADQVARVQEVNTGLTTAMEQYKCSESLGIGFRRAIPTGQPGLSGTIPLERRGNFSVRSDSVSSMRDTESASTWLERIRGGAGSHEAETRNAAGGPAGRGATSGNGDPPLGDDRDPPGPPPPPRASRRQRRIQQHKYAKLIKIKEPKRFEGTPGEDIDTCWVTMRVYIEHQPEIFPNNERTIDWIGSLMDKFAAA